MRLLILTTALLLPVATAQITINDIPALPPGVTAPPAPSAPAEPAAPEPAPAPETPAPTETPAAPTAGPVAKVEIQEVEVTAPASTGSAPTVASDDVGEVLIPLLATDADGNPVPGVTTTWEVKNTGKNPIYVIQSKSGADVSDIAATIAPDETYKVELTTGADGTASLLLNATASTAAALKVTSSLGDVKNMRDAAQSIDWIGGQ